MIKVRKQPKRVGARTTYYITEDLEKLQKILNQYDIELPFPCKGFLVDGKNALVFWKEELESIEEQYKLARKRNNIIGKKFPLKPINSS